MSVLLVTAVMPAKSSESESPFEAYKNYLLVIEKATTLEEITPFWTRRRLLELENNQEQDRQTLFYNLKFMKVKDISFFRDKIAGDHARLFVTGRFPLKNLDGRGKILLDKEDGCWKIDKEEWTYEVKR
jgi:hypothetical protein